jgi:hypothetical protein
MKKIFILAAVMSSALTLSAQLPAVTGAPADKQSKVIRNWLVQSQKCDKETVQTKVDKNGKVTSHVFTPVKDGFIFFSGKALKYQKGDSFELTCKVKGSGSITLGYIAYNNTNQYLMSQRSKSFTLKDGVENTFKAAFTVADGKEFPTATIRPFIGVNRNAKIELLDLKMIDEE